MAALAAATLFGLIGCGKEATITNKTSLGKIVDAEVVPTSFNECQKMRVKTEKAVVIIYTLTSVDIGREAWSIEWSDGQRTLEWDGSRRAYRY